MSSILIINAAGRETRVALVENGSIAEFYLERKKDRGIVGNVYKGRVTRVLPGMQAAFVDIGLDKAAFLYVGDVLFDPDVARHQFELTEGEQEEVPEVPDDQEEPTSGSFVLPVPSSPPAPSAPDSAPELTAGALSAPELTLNSSQDIALPSPIPQLADPGLATPSADAGPAGAVGSGQGQPVSQPPPEPPAAGDSAVVPMAGPTTPPSESGSREAPRTQAQREARRESDRRDRDRERRRPDAPRKQARIEDLLKVGQEVLVQVSKDPIGSKGARLTSHISIPGRHLVFMPTVDHVGISRRISNERERRRLRDTVERLRPPGTGFIVRTVAEAVPQEKLEADIRFLIEVWNETVRKAKKNQRPGLLHPDLDLILRATRDLFARDVEKLVIDDREEFERVRNFVVAQDPALKDRVEQHEGEEPIFDAYGIEDELRRATARKVWLKSGGYLILDQAEALTAIDVNSGRYVGKKNLEDTITRINVEAAKEIVYQLRLRNIGGIIICDFIDMEKQQNRDKVFKALQEAMGRDKAKTNVLRISELGLVEMTRKRVRESIGRVLHEDCAYCGGQGYLKTGTTVAYEIFRELRRSGPAYRDPTLVVQCQTEVANILQGEEREELRHLMDRYNKSIQVRPRQDYHREQYDIYARPVSGLELKVATSTADHGEAPAGGLVRKPGAGVPERRPERPNDRDRKGGGSGRWPRDRNDRNDRQERGARGGRGDRGGRGGEAGGERGPNGADAAARPPASAPRPEPKPDADAHSQAQPTHDE